MQYISIAKTTEKYSSIKINDIDDKRLRGR